MSFAAQVEAATTTKTTSVGHVVQALNVLPKKLRAEVIEFIENPPPGTQKVAIARALTSVAAQHGYEVKLTASHLNTFVDGDRHGLQT